jgi:hypothetical protein
LSRKDARILNRASRGYHIKLALQRLWNYKHRDFAEAYLKK